MLRMLAEAVQPNGTAPAVPQPKGARRRRLGSLARAVTALASGVTVAARVTRRLASRGAERRKQHRF